MPRRRHSRGDSISSSGQVGSSSQGDIDLAHLMSPFIASEHQDTPNDIPSYHATQGSYSVMERIDIYPPKKGGVYTFSHKAIGIAIRDDLLARITDFWTSFDIITSEVRKAMFEEFRRKFAWKGLFEEFVKKAWKSVAANRYRDGIYEMQSSRKRHAAMAEEIFARFLIYWESDEFKRKSEQNTKVRSTNPRLHGGGSRSYAEHKRDMIKEEGVEPTDWRVYCRTHKIESADGSSTIESWFSKKSCLSAFS